MIAFMIIPVMMLMVCGYMMFKTMQENAPGFTIIFTILFLVNLLALYVTLSFDPEHENKIHALAEKMLIQECEQLSGQITVLPNVTVCITDNSRIETSDFREKANQELSLEIE